MLQAECVTALTTDQWPSVLCTLQYTVWTPLTQVSGGWTSLCTSGKWQNSVFFACSSTPHVCSYSDMGHRSWSLSVDLVQQSLFCLNVCSASISRADTSLTFVRPWGITAMLVASPMPTKVPSVWSPGLEPKTSNSNSLVYKEWLLK